MKIDRRNLDLPAIGEPAPPPERRPTRALRARSLRCHQSASNPSAGVCRRPHRRAAARASAINKDWKFCRIAVRNRPQFAALTFTYAGWDNYVRGLGRLSGKWGHPMINVESYREYAADCLRRAENEGTPEDKNILLNLALAWVRLAQQTRTIGEAESAAAPANEAPPESSELAS
jgi:hypothetical protein